MKHHKKRVNLVSACIILALVICVMLFIVYLISVKTKEKPRKDQEIATQEAEDDTENADTNGADTMEESNESNKEMIPNTLITEAGLLTVPDVESAYAIIDTLDEEDEWIPGRIDGVTGSVIVDFNYLSLNQYLPVDVADVEVTTNSNRVRILVNQYNGENRYIGSADLGDGDILHISAVVNYITISIYQYKNRRIVDCSEGELLKRLQEGISISMTRVADLEKLLTKKERLVSEVHIESLSNYHNYRYGWYQSWGGAYEYVEGSMCTRNFYEVDGEPYVLNVNDSRIAVTITEYDKEGKWLKYNDSLINGETFQKQPDTVYIGVTIASRKWGVNLLSLFQSGLRIDLASEQYMNHTPTISYSDAEFSQINHWKSGYYLYETGEYTLDYSKVCFDSFCQIDGKEYVVNLPSSELRMSIVELDEEGNSVQSDNLHDGQKWKKSDKTDKIAISIYDSQNQFTLLDYQEALQSDPTIGLTEYVRYDHNTQIQNLSAWEYIGDMTVGWNLGNSLDCKSEVRSNTENLKQELNWGNPYVTKELIDYVAESGFHTIRIPVTWYYNTYEDEAGKLKINEEWLNRVQDIVDYAIAKGLYVLLNTHHEQPILYTGVDEATMNEVLLHAKELWTEIAEHFKTYDEHLLFESYNEIDNIESSWNYSDLAAEQMNELNQVFVDAVRSTGGNNANRILVVPTLLDGSNTKFYAAFRLPKDIVPDKLIVQVHLYSKKVNQEIEGEFEQLEQFSQRIGAPILIGEFGTKKESMVSELRMEHASNYIARAAQHGIKCIWWDNGTDYKVIDRRDLTTSDHKLIEALLEGSRGIAYEVKVGVTLDSLEQFSYRMPNLSTGSLENTSWGTLTLDFAGSAFPVDAGKILTILIKVKNEAASIKLQRLLFYSNEGALVEGGKELQSTYYLGVVPIHATSMRVSVNSPSKNITKEEFEEYLKAGDFVVEIHMFLPDEVEQIQLAK